MTTKTILVDSDNFASVIEIAIKAYPGEVTSHAAETIAAFLLNYYPAVPVSPRVPNGQTAYMIKDNETGSLVNIYSPFLSKHKCEALREQHYSADRFSVVRMEEVI